MRRELKRLGVLGALVVLGLLPACQRREGVPTLPKEPERVRLAFRLVSAQTGRPVGGAKVLVRRADRERKAGQGEVLAEAVSGPDGWVETEFFRRDEWDPVYLDIDAGPRFLHRYVWVDDTQYEPAPDVRTLWELNPEIGADVCLTYAMIFSCSGLEGDPRRTCQNCTYGSLRVPPDDVYVILHPDFWPHDVWGYFEEAARRLERALQGRWRWRILRNVWLQGPDVPQRAEDPWPPPDSAWPPEVPQNAFLIAVFPRYVRPNCASSASGAHKWGHIALCFDRKREVRHILHEFGHMAGLSHLPAGVRGLMASRPYCYDCQDFTDAEKWVIGAMRFRRSGMRAPDDQLQPE